MTGYSVYVQHYSTYITGHMCCYIPWGSRVALWVKSSDILSCLLMWLTVATYGTKLIYKQFNAFISLLGKISISVIGNNYYFYWTRYGTAVKTAETSLGISIMKLFAPDQLRQRTWNIHFSAWRKRGGVCLRLLLVHKIWVKFWVYWCPEVVLVSWTVYPEVGGSDPPLVPHSQMSYKMSTPTVLMALGRSGSERGAGHYPWSHLMLKPRKLIL